MIRPALLAAALAAGLAPAAQAGGLAATVIEPVVIVEPPPEPRSSLGIALPLVILGLLVAVAISRDDDEEETFAVSDARLKTDVVRTGTSPSGLPVYHYSYPGLPGTYEGVMAQDLVTLRPDAVVDGPMGLMMVDYGRLDVDFRRID